MKSDIQIAREAQKLPIAQIAGRLGLAEADFLPYGRDKAKIAHEAIAGLAGRPQGRLILVTAINPTPAGEGKTTTTVGLGDALNRIGKRATVCIREASLGPNFGMKGGAAGGGHAQIVPMEDMNLHFTGDFHAVTSAHNLLARRQKWIDQSQSLNIYMAGVSGKKLDDTYKLAWLRGLKTTYYLRSLGATMAEKSTVQSGALNAVPAHGGIQGVSSMETSTVEIKYCAIDDESCESCQ